MNLYIYTDESGVFDKVHNQYYVYGGVLFLDSKSRDKMSRKYLKAEKDIRKNYADEIELKACVISNKDKGKIFRSLNEVIKFGVIINQNTVLDEIFNDKKSKQRYLDYAYKIMIKKVLRHLENNELLSLDDIDDICIYCDEHNTATNGIYELKEGIYQELKNGTFNHKYEKFFKPICPKMGSVYLNYYNSKTTTLIRAADIVANRIYYSVTSDKLELVNSKVFLTCLP